jgi:hypothetical protein
MAEYRNPNREKLQALLDQHARHLTPRLCRAVQRAVDRLDNSDPQAVIRMLPPEVTATYIRAFAHSLKLPLMSRRAQEAGAWVEMLVLSHNLIKLALRLTYVLAWQRTVGRPLSADDLRPFFDGYSKKADVYWLVGTLRKNKLLIKEQARLLWDVNAWRNDAVHGLAFGQIEYEQLRPRAERANHAALGALEVMRAWLNNPRPLPYLPQVDGSDDGGA